MLIHDVPEFNKRLAQATRAQYRNVVKGPASCPTIYFDPFGMENVTDGLEIAFGKHFRYAYQREYRYIWLPKSTDILEPIHLNLGPLADIAEIVAQP